VAGVFVPSALVFFLLALPYLDRNPGRRARERKVAIVFGTLVVAFLLGLTLVGMFFRGAGWNWVWPWEPGHYIEL
jgi:quinol-cytochrome oxidoreductase complex cytochrome b subunit